MSLYYSPAYSWKSRSKRKGKSNGALITRGGWAIILFVLLWLPSTEAFMLDMCVYMYVH